MNTPSTSSSRIEDFSLLDPRVQSDPREFYSLLHEQRPVYLMPEMGMYVVARYEDARAMVQDHETFSSSSNLIGSKFDGSMFENYNKMLAEKGWARVDTLSWTDPPEHGRYRAIVDKVFNVRYVRELQPHIAQVANDLIDKFIDRGECEFVSEFALPLPGIIIAEQLGLDRSKYETFKRWANAIVTPGVVPMNHDQLRATAEIELEMQHYLAATFEERRLSPTDDLISKLVHARGEDERPLSMHELQSTMCQLIAAGYDTTISALGTGLWLLLRFPEQMAKLRSNPALVRGFVAESLRYEAPVQGMFRVATRDVEIAGTMIPEGSLVMARFGAANHDPSKFACPHQFDMERKNAGAHLAFGNGIHFCVGRLLAMEELETAFSILLSRLDDITLAQPLPDLPHKMHPTIHSLKELPIRFTKVAQAGMANHRRR